MTIKRKPWHYTLLAISVGLALSGNSQAVTYNIQDNDTDESFVASDVDEKYVLSGSLSQGQEKDFTITGQGDKLNNKLNVDWSNSLTLSNNSSLLLRINSDIETTSGSALSLVGYVGDKVAVEINGNISTSYSDGWATVGTLLDKVASLETTENSQIVFNSTAANSGTYGLELREIYAMTGKGRIEVSSSGEKTDSRGIYTSGTGTLLSMLLDTTSDIQAVTTGAQGNAYGVYLENFDSSQNITQLGHITVSSSGGSAFGIFRSANVDASPDIVNGDTGVITVNASGKATGIDVNVFSSILSSDANSANMVDLT